MKPSVLQAGLRLPRLPTTVVGSFPARPNGKALMDSRMGGQDPFIQSIGEALEAQISAGIDIVSDGQTRNDMIRLYASKLSGIRMRSKPVIISDIGYKGPITIKDQKLARQMIGKRAMLKGLITGPFTLAMSCHDAHYGSLEKVATAFAEALNNEARALSGVVDILQVDEPFFSVEYPEYAEMLVSTMFSGVDVPKALHVCGDVSGIFHKLVDLPVDILDHEFAAHPELLDVISDVDFKQIIGYGCVRSDVDSAEPVDVISERIKKVVGCVGHERVMLDPDCGLRHLSPAVARAKLENLVKARDMVIEDEG